MNKRTLLFVEIGVVVAVLFLLIWIIIPKFLGAQLNIPRVFPDDYMRASVERFMGVGTFEPFTRTELEEQPGQLVISNSHNFTGLEHLKNIDTLHIQSESPTESPVDIILPELLKLKSVLVTGKMFTSLDARKAINLRGLQSRNTSINTLLLDGLNHLELISMSDQVFKSLDLSNNPNLKYFWMVRNNQLEEIIFPNNNKIETLKIMHTMIQTIDLSQSPELTELDIRFNQLSHIDLSKNTKLKDARLSNDTLSSIDIANCLELERLGISNSKISAIDISQHKNLRNIYINKTPMKSIDASQNPNLQSIAVSVDQLFEMEITYANPSLYLEVIPPFKTYSVKQIDQRKREIFKSHFPDLNPNEYILKQQ